jgi:hypothetical protein
MTGDRKGKKEQLGKRSFSHRMQPDGKLMTSFRSLMEADRFFQLIGALLQIGLGLVVVFVSILGLLQPLWLAALITVLASANVMVGIWSLYRLFTAGHLFDSLINRAIRRAIQSQN